MKKLNFVLSAALALVVAGSTQTAAFAQGLVPQAEGSRPGQTYIEGQTAPAQPAPQQAAPVRPSAQRLGAAPDQARPVAQRPSANAATPAAGQPVILEFSDLQCPDSARYNMGLKSTVLQRYVSTGRVNYQWHDFPLPVHDKAIEAAAAARCAGAAADAVRHKIMANQAQMNPAQYARYAQEAGVNPQQFTDCMRSNQHRDDVLRDKALGQSYGVKGTPSLVLGVMQKNGQVRPMKVVKGYEPPQQVLSEIDQWLASLKTQQGQAQR